MLTDKTIKIINDILATGRNVIISPSDNGRIVIREMAQKTIYDSKNKK